MLLQCERLADRGVNADVGAHACDLNVLQFWDTAGQERLESLGKMTLRGCHGALIVYNNYDDKSFQCAKRFIRMVQEVGSFCSGLGDFCPYT